jgi:23S rRNA (cytidine2498-2'-O)-methyltransferase
VALSSQFAFVLCQHGAENALTGMLAREQPAWRAAYRRPGLLTFRCNGELGADVQVASPLARVHGLSFGTHANLDALVQRIADLALDASSPLRLHVIDREQLRAGDGASDDSAPSERARQLDTELRQRMPERWHTSPRAEPNDLVADVVLGQPREPLLLGLHRHTPERSPNPAGTYSYEVPADAPSRAFRKLEEAIAAFELSVRQGDSALELGAAPGGAVYALLRRGVSVHGVDPAAMDPHVLAFTGPGGARLTHVQEPMNAVDVRTLPRHIDWLLLDVHLAPQVALRQASRFLSHYRSSLLGAVLTLKLNDWSFLDELPRFTEDARALGLVDPKARQLPAHRRELALAGLTKLGKKRSRDS